MIMAKLKSAKGKKFLFGLLAVFHYCGVGCDSRDYRRRYRTVQYSAVGVDDINVCDSVIDDFCL